MKDENGEDLKVLLKLPVKNLYLKVWKINVGRITLYLLDSDIPENTDEMFRNITLNGNQKSAYGCCRGYA